MNDVSAALGCLARFTEQDWSSDGGDLATAALGGADLSVQALRVACLALPSCRPRPCPCWRRLRLLVSATPWEGTDLRTNVSSPL